MAAKIALPAKAKITALVCSGRIRPKDRYSIPKFSAGKGSCNAISSPTSMPMTPQMYIASKNMRTMVSS